MVIALKRKASGSAVRLGITLGAVVFAALGAGNTASVASEIRVSGLVSTHKYHVALEREFYKSLSDKTGIKINYNPLDVLGVSRRTPFVWRVLAPSILLSQQPAKLRETIRFLRSRFDRRLTLIRH